MHWPASSSPDILLLPAPTSQQEDEAGVWEDEMDSDTFYLHPYGRMAVSPQHPRSSGGTSSRSLSLQRMMGEKKE